MAVPAAFFIEKFHVKNLVVTGLVLSSIFYSLQMMTMTEASLFAFGLLASMSQALFNISVSPFYLRNSSPQQRVHLFSLNSALNMIAHLFGYLLGGYLPEIIRSIYPSLDSISLYRYSIMMSLGIVFSSNIMFLRIKNVYRPYLVRNAFHGLTQKSWIMMGKLIVPKLCFAFGGGLIVPFMNIYLKEKFGFSTQSIGVSYAMLQLFIFAGIFMTPMLVKRTTHLKFILMTATLSIPFMLTMGLTGNLILVISSFFMRGMLMNMSSPITSMFEMEHVKEQECVFASAMILFFYHMVYNTSTRLGGMMIEKYSFSATFFTAAFFYASAIFLYYQFFKKEDQNQTTAEIKLIEAA